MRDGVFVGLATIDIEYQVDRFPAANSKVVARSQDLLVGGPATNAAVTFSQLGGTSTLLSVVGCHPLASIIREELQNYGVRLIDLAPEYADTPVISSIAVTPNGDRSIVSTNATRFREFTSRVDEAVLGDRSVILFDGHLMAASTAWSAAARAHRIKTVFDGGSWKAGTDELLVNIDFAICSANFLPPGCSDEDQVFQYVEDRGVPNIAVTHGPAPVRYRSPRMEGHIEVPLVCTVDTTGAGDIFHGAFCYYASAGEGLLDALRDAAKIASEPCRSHGTRAWIQSFREGLFT